MNIFVEELASGELSKVPDQGAGKLVVEDNVGESVHIHFQHFRIEMTIDDFRDFASQVEDTEELI